MMIKVPGVQYAMVTMVGLLIGAVTGCGLVDPKVVRRQQPREVVIKPEVGNSADSAFDAMPPFTAAFGNTIDRVCRHCHGPSHKLPMQEGRLDIVRVRLRELAECNAETLRQYFAQYHPGGDQTGTLDFQSIGSWLSAEPECQKGR